MPSIQSDTPPHTQAEFIIRPNGAYNARSWIWVFALLVFVSLTVAIRFALLGYWVILPFALLDVLAVGLVLHLVTERSSYIEKIVISPQSVEIFHIQKKADNQWQFPLYWTRINLQNPRYRWYPHRLLLGSKGKWVEIGRCLTNDERHSLAAALENEIARLSAIPAQIS